MKSKITMCILAILWQVIAMVSNSDIYLLISQLWLIASWFIKDGQ